MASARHNRRRRRGRGRFGPRFQLLCAVAVVLALTVGATVFFRVETVVVTGNSRYTQEEIVAVSGIEIEDNLYAMNKFQIQQQIREQLPYISEVSIQRSLPSTILIHVVECQAVAQVMPGQGSAQAPPPATEPDVSAEGGEEAAAEEEQPLEQADEAWLISATGKLLEPAPADSEVLEVTGLTLLMPRAGTMIAVSEEEGVRRTALLGLLDALEAQGMLDQVSSIRLESTQLYMRYLDRFDVKMLLNGDFSHLLWALDTAVADLDQRVGPTCTGTLDLTSEQYQVIYSQS